MCDSTSITDLLTLQANEFTILRVLHVQASLAINVAAKHFSVVHEILNSCENLKTH